jgi:hypothetical protein
MRAPRLAAQGSALRLEDRSVFEQTPPMLVADRLAVLPECRSSAPGNTWALIRFPLLQKHVVLEFVRQAYPAADGDIELALLIGWSDVAGIRARFDRLNVLCW